MIPDEFHNLPVHALAVHGAVVLVPLAVLLALLFALPKTRAWAALPMLIVSVVALLNVIVAKISGGHLKTALEALSGDPASFQASPVGKAIKDHESKANWLLILMIGFAVIAVAVYLLYRQADRFTGTVEYAACGVLVIAALVVAFQTYRVGEAGSKAVWNPDGNTQYKSSAPLLHPASPLL